MERDARACDTADWKVDIAVSDAILDSRTALEAERRVYYVAITRANKRLVYVYNLFDRCESFLKR